MRNAIGVESFLAKHPQAAPLHDIAHQAANQLKRELQADPRWSAFLGLTGTIKQRLALSPRQSGKSSSAACCV